jgi:ClpP class serine protease
MLTRIASAVYFQPWSIRREDWLAVHAIVKPRLLETTSTDLMSAIRRDGTIDESSDIWGQPLPKMEMEGGTAVIPVNGVLIHHASLLEKQCGAASYDDISRDVRAAVNAGVERIVLHIDSPGGMSMGSHECAKVVQRAREFCRIEAVTDSLMCSAAYELAAAAHAISSTATATVGNVGCFMAWLDESVRYEMAGLKVELFASGPLKAAGTEGTTLTAEQRAYFQGRVDAFANMFKSHVRAWRMVEDSSMNGAAFLGTEALEVGIIDDLVDDCAAVIG